jgi:hypothetical protein
MGSLRSALDRVGTNAEEGLRRTLPVRPASLRELIRVATLPEPRLADLEPDDPAAIESFEVEDPQGIAYGSGDLWFLSSQSTIRPCTIEGDDPLRPASVRRGSSRTLGQLLEEAGLSAPLPIPVDYDHIGDLGYSDPLLYAPIRRTDADGPNLIMGLSRDLQVVGWAELSGTTGESTCAINPWNGLLYLPSGDDTGRLEAYTVAALVERFGRPSQWGRRVVLEAAPAANIQLLTPEGAPDGEGMQGLAFSANGRIYVTRSGDEPYINRIFVYNALTGRRFGSERTWNFPGDGDEIEGIAVHPAGALYLSVNDNDAEFPPFSQDNFDLYTLRFRTLGAREI